MITNFAWYAFSKIFDVHIYYILLEPPEPLVYDWWDNNQLNYSANGTHSTVSLIYFNNYI